jgi:glutaredoxin-dependent peroxiredoxin
MGLLRDRSDELVEAGVQLYGISRDSPWTHIAWLQALDLTFPLLSDWNAEAVHAFGVAQDFRGFKDVAKRSAFIVDSDGVVRFVRTYANDEVPDFDELLQAAHAAP